MKSLRFYDMPVTANTKLVLYIYAEIGQKLVDDNCSTEESHQRVANYAGLSRIEVERAIIEFKRLKTPVRCPDTNQTVKTSPCPRQSGLPSSVRELKQLFFKVAHKQAGKDQAKVHSTDYIYLRTACRRYNTQKVVDGIYAYFNGPYKKDANLGVGSFNRFLDGWVKKQGSY